MFVSYGRYDQDVTTLGEDEVGAGEFEKITTLEMELAKVVGKLTKARVAQDAAASLVVAAKVASKLLKEFEHLGLMRAAWKHFASWTKDRYTPQIGTLRAKAAEAKRKSLVGKQRAFATDTKPASKQLAKIRADLATLDAARAKKEGAYKKALRDYWQYV